MKTKEELTQLKEEYESLSNKLKELTEDELKEVTAGSMPEIKKTRIMLCLCSRLYLLRQSNLFIQKIVSISHHALTAAKNNAHIILTKLVIVISN